jgi:serine/threonine protein kinase
LVASEHEQQQFARRSGPLPPTLGKVGSSTKSPASVVYCLFFATGQERRNPAPTRGASCRLSPRESWTRGSSSTPTSTVTAPPRRGRATTAVAVLPGELELIEEISIDGVEHPDEGKGPDWPDRVGEIIAGRYKLTAVIDAGGQGVVYRALDLIGHDEVAIKMLKNAAAHNSEWRARMFREAQALAVLSGTSAVRILDQRWTSDGMLCLVMELLHGADLETVLERLRRRGLRFPLDGLDMVFAPVVSTLERAHEQGILHRDLKPANIYVVDAPERPTVKLLDFGFAKFLRMPSLTLAGTVAGSPSYIAPETWMGLGPRVDHRIDVYGLAAVLFGTLGGRPPFMAQDVAELYQMVITAPRPSLQALRPELPSEVDAWVEQSLAIDPEQRFSSVRAMYTALRTALRLPGTEHDSQSRG